jgi:hypothetical protein
VVAVLGGFAVSARIDLARVGDGAAYDRPRVCRDDEGVADEGRHDMLVARRADLACPWHAVDRDGVEHRPGRDQRADAVIVPSSNTITASAISLVRLQLSTDTVPVPDSTAKAAAGPARRH